MLFNSLNFVVFLPIVFLLYWFVAKGNLKFQNIILLISSCYFYACWDLRFLFLLLFSIVLNYFIGIKISVTIYAYKKFWFWLSIVVNLGILGVFKYFNFFADTFISATNMFGLEINPLLLSIVLPIGISFYTFHGLSYVIDIYKDKISPEFDVFNFALFVSFFPLLIAGPIERATHLLPQINKLRTFDFVKSVDGLRQILWGLFKKIVIADQCAGFSNQIFNNSTEYSGSTLVLGVFFFAFQIYGDFSGYADIALGTARLFGIELLNNFAFPYFSRDIPEFWRRWHMSLSSWFRDYLYIPLGGNKAGTMKTVRNIFIVFIVCGFWHGANWTFLVWGAINAIFMLPSLILYSNRKEIEIVAKGKYLPTFKELLAICLTFILVMFGWIFFRAENLGHATHYISQIFSSSIFTIPVVMPKVLFILLVVFIVIEWWGREQSYAIANIGMLFPRAISWLFYYMIIFAVFYFAGAEQQFIYFQF